MAQKTKTQRKKLTARNKPEIDSVFLLKLVLYLILGSLWVKVTHGNNLQIPLPLGFIVGLFFTVHEHFRIDRKIEYAVLLVALLIGFWAPFGLFIRL